MGNNYIADLAKQNINILGIEFQPASLYAWVTFEFQWRDARTHYTKWSKTATRVKISIEEYAGNYLADELIKITKQARESLEGYSDGRE